MPRFTLIKHADSTYDAEVKMEFEAEVLDLARAHYEDFLQASGFELPTTEYLKQREREEDQMWNEAFDFKFGDDGPVGAEGADVLRMSDYKEPFIPTFHD